MTHVILGGGVAGLSTAFYLLKQPGVRRIVVLESSDRLGGWIDTTRHPDGVIYEHGPRTVRPAGPQGANTLAMVQELGLVDSVRSVKYGHPSTTNRMVYTNGQLHKLPSNLVSVFRNLPPFERPLFLSVLRDLRAPVKKCSDTPLFEFISRRFGEDVAQYAVDPLVRGICAGNSREISVHFIAKYLHDLEQSSGSILKGYAKDHLKGIFFPPEKTPEENCEVVKQARSEKWAVWGLENGLTTLTETLSNYLKERGVEIFMNQSISNIDVRSSGCVVNCGSSVFCDKLTLAVPSNRAANLTRGISPALSDSLSGIPYVDVGVVNLEFKGNILNSDGFGFLVPSNQPQPILGCIFDTCSFKQGNRTLLTVMMGGAWFESLFKNKTEEELESIALKTISNILNITETPVRTKTKILRECIAQYTVGHLERVARARSIIKTEDLPLSIVGSSYDGVGINDTIMSAKKSVI